MMRNLILVVAALTMIVGCSKPEKTKAKNTLRSRAEKTTCSLDQDLFRAPVGAALVQTVRNRDNLKGLYKIISVEVYQYVNGLDEESGTQIDGSSRLKYDVENNTEVQSAAGQSVCDSNGPFDQTKPSQTPAPEKLVIVESEGASQFNLPSANVSEKFRVKGNVFERKSLSVSTIEQLRDSGDYHIDGQFTSVQTFLLKEGGVMIITFVETKKSITVTRATFKKAEQAETEQE